MDTPPNGTTDPDVPPLVHATTATETDVLPLHITVLATTLRDAGDPHLTDLAPGALHPDDLVTGIETTLGTPQAGVYALLPPLAHTEALAPLQVSLKVSPPASAPPKEERSFTLLLNKDLQAPRLMSLVLFNPTMT